jgi:hypothetical protein
MFATERRGRLAKTFPAVRAVVGSQAANVISNLALKLA